MKTIAVIGAGLSGTLLVSNLLRRESRIPVKIFWIDRNPVRDLGPAYSTDEDHLLNVPVEVMGAYSDDPEHFLKWSRERNPEVKKGKYLPRKLYREYIHSVYKNSLKGKSENMFIERIRGEVIDIEKNGDRLQLFLEDSGTLEADMVVLAPGNYFPPHQQLRDMTYIHHEHYIHNPWDPELLNIIEENDSVMFIGTGQTMVDLATSLFKKGHKAKLSSLSRRGILPMCHTATEPYPPFYDELKDYREILPIYATVKKHINGAMEKGQDPRAVIDSLRPYSGNIWMNLPTEEKERFLRHLFRYWEIIRSRIPKENEQVLKQMISSGQLQILAGNIQEINPFDDGFKVSYRERSTKNEKTVNPDFIINCKGPNQDYAKIEDRLIKNLMAKGFICCNPVHLGVNAIPDGTVIGPDNKPSTGFFTIGPPIRGIVWESIATPEIRVQAENLSEKLIRRMETVK